MCEKITGNVMINHATNALLPFWVAERSKVIVWGGGDWFIGQCLGPCSMLSKVSLSFHLVMFLSAWSIVCLRTFMYSKCLVSVWRQAVLLGTLSSFWVTWDYFVSDQIWLRSRGCPNMDIFVDKLTEVGRIPPWYFGVSNIPHSTAFHFHFALWIIFATEMG